MTYAENPLTDNEGNNAFALHALLELPLEVVFKPTREQILKAWELDEAPGGEVSTRSNPLDPAVLSLKIKMMQNPMIHDVYQILSPNSLHELTSNRIWCLKSLFNLRIF